MSEHTVPLWRDRRVREIALQAMALLGVIGVLLVLIHNLRFNLGRLGLKFGFDFLERPASFAIGDTAISFSPTDSYRRALWVGLLNTLRVMVLGIVLATILGILAGISRISSNWLVGQVAAVYVQVFRNTPLLLQLFFWYFAVFLKLPRLENRLVLPGGIYLSKRGLDLPWPALNWRTAIALLVILASIGGVIALWRWQLRSSDPEIVGRRSPWLLGLGLLALGALVLGLDWEIPEFKAETSNIVGGINLSPEFATLLVGLTVYTGAFIAEVVRAGIQSVPKGQWEAANALGLPSGLVMRLVVFPQALRVMIPPLTSEYLNLAKNSSLAIAIGYSDIYAIASTTANQTGRSLEMLLTVMAAYLTINLLISLTMNRINRSVQIKER
ncbi:MAG: ABC transporter permease subunit [Chloroflexaceae bacterium]|nr:ABC transporter permease subunit [Chloroflexaceae bacterium]